MLQLFLLFPMLKMLFYIYIHFQCFLFTVFHSCIFTFPLGCRHFYLTYFYLTIFFIAKWDSSWRNNLKSECVVPTSLQRPVFTATSQIQMLHWTAGHIPTSMKCKTKRGGLCVYVIDARCSHAVKNDDGQCLPWWRLFNSKTILSL